MHKTYQGQKLPPNIKLIFLTCVFSPSWLVSEICSLDSPSQETTRQPQFSKLSSDGTIVNTFSIIPLLVPPLFSESCLVPSPEVDSSKSEEGRLLSCLISSQLLLLPSLYSSTYGLLSLVDLFSDSVQESFKLQELKCSMKLCQGISALVLEPPQIQ